MKSTTLIVPGLDNSGAGHWQSWLEERVDDAHRVQQQNWAEATIADWTSRVGEAIDAAIGPIWVVAHSFGCLAAVKAAVDCSDRVAGALLVAPANPERFSERGLEPNSGAASIVPLIPHQPLGFPSVVVASSNDPWMRLTAASVWANRWGSQFECIGRAGHINVESGHGPWPKGLDLFERFRTAHGGEPLGAIEAKNGNAHTRRGERMLEQQWLG